MPAAAFEQMWFTRMRAVMLEGAVALALVANLCGDPGTVAAIQAGDTAARHQVEDAFRCLTEIGARLDELGPAPSRLSSIDGIVRGAFAAFACAADGFTASTQDGVDADGLHRAAQHVRDGTALLDELRETSEVRPEQLGRSRLNDAG